MLYAECDPNRSKNVASTDTFSSTTSHDIHIA